MSPVAIDARDLARSFPSSSGRVLALRGMDLVVPAGQTVGVLGANGAGKTTLIKIIATLLLPTAGTVRVFGHDVRRETARARARLAVVFGGERGLYNRLSVLDNLRYFALLQGVPAAALYERCRATLAKVNLADAAERRVEVLSRGMRQRLHLAVGLVADPDLLMLDEPTIGLDPLEARRLRRLVRDCAGAGTTVVITSHYLRDIEELADRVVLLEHGTVKHDLSTADFQRLVGDVAVIRVRISESQRPDMDRLRRHAPVELTFAEPLPADDGQHWELRLRTRTWSPEVFGFLRRLSEMLTVETVDIDGLGLEDVFVELHRSSDPAW